MQSLTAAQPQRRVPRRRAQSKPKSFRPGPWAARALLVAALAGLSAASLRHGIDLAAVRDGAGRIAVAAGLGVDEIAISGFKNTLPDDIFRALDADKPVSVLAYDTASAEKRLAELPWVASAEVTRALPRGLSVRISERAPFAVWQNRQLDFLIDAEGRTLEPTMRGLYKDLPLVVGAGAEAAVADLLKVLESHPVIRERLKAAIRVGGRRWDLDLAGAPRLMLPTDDVEAALTRVEQLESQERIFERRIAVIDLRLADRTAFRLSPGRGGGA